VNSRRHAGAKYATETDDMDAWALSLPQGTYVLSIEGAGHTYTQQAIVIIPQHRLRHDVTFALP
jgi:hypothetical protein